MIQSRTGPYMAKNTHIGSINIPDITYDKLWENTQAVAIARTTQIIVYK
jgi:hypothetical protein